MRQNGAFVNREPDTVTGGEVALTRTRDDRETFNSFFVVGRLEESRRLEVCLG